MYIDVLSSCLVPSLEQLDPVEKMTYTMQAVKRSHCQRLSCFIRLCDYLVVNMLHKLALASVEHILVGLQRLVAQHIAIDDITEPIAEDETEGEPIPLLPLRTPVSSVQNTPSVS